MRRAGRRRLKGRCEEGREIKKINKGRNGDEEEEEERMKRGTRSQAHQTYVSVPSGSHTTFPRYNQLASLTTGLLTMFLALLAYRKVLSVSPKFASAGEMATEQAQNENMPSHL